MVSRGTVICVMPEIAYGAIMLLYFHTFRIVCVMPDILLWYSAYA